MSADANELDLRAIEKEFIRIDDGETGYPKCTVVIEINNFGSWVVKFTKYGIIVNNMEVIFKPTETSTSATIKFQSSAVFWKTINGGERYEDGISKGVVKHSGSQVAIDLARRKVFRSDSADLREHAQESRHGSSGGCSSGPHEPTHNTPIKSGWLLKKRDIIFGWQCRYFVVYVGRMEYYIDQHDQVPRGVIHLFGADVQSPKQSSVNGVNDHWAFSIEPKNIERSFKLASELTGEEGMVDATSWVQAVSIASKPADSATGLYGYLPVKSMSPGDMRNSDQHDVAKSPMKVTVSREKDRGIRKVQYFSGSNIAVLSVCFAVLIGLAVAMAFSYSEPNVTWINLAGVALLVCAIILAAIVFSGLIDYRGIAVTSSRSHGGSISASKSPLRETKEKTK